MVAKNGQQYHEIGTRTPDHGVGIGYIGSGTLGHGVGIEDIGSESSDMISVVDTKDW